MQAPTDNLYKFLAIAGMLCFVFFFFDLNKRADDLDSKIDTLSMQQAEFLATLEGLTESAERITKGVDVLLAGKPSAKDLKSAEDKLVVLSEKVQDKFGELKIVNAKLNKSIDLAKEYLDKLKRLESLYAILQFVSLVVAIVGVSLWYFRTQKYLDLKDKQSLNSTSP